MQSIWHLPEEKFSDGIDDEIDKRIQTISSECNRLISAPDGIKPEIKFLSILPCYLRGRYLPMVVYKTATSIDDVVRLEKENNILNKHINKTITGICDFSDSIIYRATNEELANGHLGENFVFLKRCGG